MGNDVEGWLDLNGAEPGPGISFDARPEHSCEFRRANNHKPEIAVMLLNREAKTGGQ